MLCEEVTNVKIVMHGNTYDRFYRFPNPVFVRENEVEKSDDDDDDDDEPAAGVEGQYVGFPSEMKFYTSLKLVEEQTFEEYRRQYN